MALVYFAILTPISLVIRVTGKRFNWIKIFKKKTYWIKKKKQLGTMDKQF